MKLEVGMYVRTRNGGIEKITNFKPITKYTKYNTLNFDNTLGELLFTDEELKEIKASHNIIDLIEVGDYVNGHQVYDEFRLDTDDYGNSFIEIGIECDKFLNHYIREEDIKSIVTKEQMEQMAYKVEE